MRRLIEAAGLAAAAIAGADVSAQGTATDSAERMATIARAEAELARGETLAAIDDFERAASMRHAPDAEMGSVRAALQAGRYRSALAFCAHAAGAHLEAPDGSALYAWLLRAGGQTALADRVLAAARERAPGDAVVTATQAAFAEALPIATGVLLEPPHRMAPWPTMLAAQQPPPATSRLLSGGVLIGDGTLVLVPAAELRRHAGARLWARNGLGQTTEARAQPTDAPVDALSALDTLGVAVLSLSAALPTGTSETFDAREPFAGSPGAVLAYAATAEPAWPWLRQGFFAAVDTVGAVGGSSGSSGSSVGSRPLGFGADDVPAGSPVFDAGARLVGMTLDASGGSPRWLPSSRWREAMPATPASPAPQMPPASPAPPVGRLLAPDAIYEAGLTRALQILFDDPRPP